MRWFFHARKNGRIARRAHRRIRQFWNQRPGTNVPGRLGVIPRKSRDPLPSARPGIRSA
jgi:hypothetical protein